MLLLVGVKPGYYTGSLLNLFSLFYGYELGMDLNLLTR